MSDDEGESVDRDTPMGALGLNDPLISADLFGDFSVLGSGVQIVLDGRTVTQRDS